VIDGVKTPNLVVSFNDEGYLSRDQLVEMLSARGEVQVIEIQHPRYVGARIGIHNPRGEKVGTVGRLRNVEYLFVVGDRPLRLADAA
jgi:adenine-specific DNA-methyltransferase